MIAPVLERADRDGLAAFLETGAEENLAFYARAGFEVTDEVVLPDGPTVWGLQRPAVVSDRLETKERGTPAGGIGRTEER